MWDVVPELVHALTCWMGVGIIVRGGGIYSLGTLRNYNGHIATKRKPGSVMVGGDILSVNNGGIDRVLPISSI